MSSMQGWIVLDEGRETGSAFCSSRTERRASASERVHKGLEEAHRKELGEALRIRCQAMQALHLHLVCAQRGVKALRTPQAALARPPAASLARAA